MIQDPSKDLTLIVYNTPKPPKYIKINKSLMKVLITAIPILVIASISISFFYSMILKSKLNTLSSQEPEIIRELKKEKANLAIRINALKKTNLILTDKLSKGSQETAFSPLELFIRPIGIKDLRQKETVKIEKLRLTFDEKTIKFNFDLINNSQDGKKVSGFISIVQYQDNLLQVYPKYDLSQKSLRLEFSKGESFTASRFRPVVGTFDKLTKISSKYKIYIFSRTGDLLFYKQVGPFNIE